MWPTPDFAGTRLECTPPSGKMLMTRPRLRTVAAVSKASVSHTPRCTGNAPRRLSSQPQRPSNSSLLPMNLMRRRIASATNSASSVRAVVRRGDVAAVGDVLAPGDAHARDERQHRQQQRERERLQPRHALACAAVVALEQLRPKARSRGRAAPGSVTSRQATGAGRASRAAEPRGVAALRLRGRPMAAVASGRG